MYLYNPKPSQRLDFGFVADNNLDQFQSSRAAALHVSLPEHTWFKWIDHPQLLTKVYRNLLTIHLFKFWMPKHLKPHNMISIFKKKKDFKHLDWLTFEYHEKQYTQSMCTNLQKQGKLAKPHISHLLQSQVMTPCLGFVLTAPAVAPNQRSGLSNSSPWGLLSCLS